MSSTRTSSSSSSTNRSTSANDESGGKTIGIAIGVVAGIIVCAVIGVFIYLHRRHVRSIKDEMANDDEEDKVERQFSGNYGDYGSFPSKQHTRDGSEKYLSGREKRNSRIDPLNGNPYLTPFQGAISRESLNSMGRQLGMQKEHLHPSNDSKRRSGSSFLTAPSQAPHVRNHDSIASHESIGAYAARKFEPSFGQSSKSLVGGLGNNIPLTNRSETNYGIPRQSNDIPRFSSERDRPSFDRSRLNNDSEYFDTQTYDSGKRGFATDHSKVSQLQIPPTNNEEALRKSLPPLPPVSTPTPPPAVFIPERRKGDLDQSSIKSPDQYGIDDDDLDEHTFRQLQSPIKSPDQYGMDDEDPSIHHLPQLEYSKLPADEQRRERMSIASSSFSFAQGGENIDAKGRQSTFAPLPPVVTPEAEKSKRESSGSLQKEIESMLHSNESHVNARDAYEDSYGRNKETIVNDPTQSNSDSQLSLNASLPPLPLSYNREEPKVEIPDKYQSEDIQPSPSSIQFPKRKALQPEGNNKPITEKHVNEEALYPPSDSHKVKKATTPDEPEETDRMKSVYKAYFEDYFTPENLPSLPKGITEPTESSPKRERIERAQAQAPSENDHERIRGATEQDNLMVRDSAHDSSSPALSASHSSIPNSYAPSTASQPTDFYSSISGPSSRLNSLSSNTGRLPMKGDYYEDVDPKFAYQEQHYAPRYNRPPPQNYNYHPRPYPRGPPQAYHGAPMRPGYYPRRPGPPSDNGSMRSYRSNMSPSSNHGYSNNGYANGMYGNPMGLPPPRPFDDNASVRSGRSGRSGHMGQRSPASHSSQNLVPSYGNNHSRPSEKDNRNLRSQLRQGPDW